MNEKKENESFEREIPMEKIKIQAVPFVWLFCIVVAIVMYLVTRKWMWTFDFVLGSVTAMFGFSLMVRAAMRTKPEFLKKAMTINYFIRYIMYAIVIAFVYFTDGAMGLIPLAIGLTSVKAVIFVYVLIHKGEKV